MVLFSVVLSVVLQQSLDALYHKDMYGYLTLVVMMFQPGAVLSVKKLQVPVYFLTQNVMFKMQFLNEEDIWKKLFGLGDIHLIKLRIII